MLICEHEPVAQIEIFYTGKSNIFPGNNFQHMITIQQQICGLLKSFYGSCGL